MANREITIRDVRLRPGSERQMYGRDKSGIQTFRWIIPTTVGAQQQVGPEPNWAQMAQQYRIQTNLLFAEGNEIELAEMNAPIPAPQQYDILQNQQISAEAVAQ